MSDCNHSNDVIDQHAGNYVCITCGLVKDDFYISNQKVDSEYQFTKKKPTIASTIIEKSNLPDSYEELIKENQIQNETNIKKITSLLYQRVNQKESILPLKQLINISGLRSRDIKTETDIHSVRR